MFGVCSLLAFGALSTVGGGGLITGGDFIFSYFYGGLVLVVG